MRIDRIDWPDLPQTGFIKGRPATLEDAQRRDAIFFMAEGGQRALPIEVPQYAIWLDEQEAKHPMILVQAEQTANGTEMVGLRDLHGGETVATLAEVTLLGTKKPD